MKVIVIGSNLCPNTMKALEQLEQAQVEFEFQNISADLAVLKSFLYERDTSDLFDLAKAEKRIGIPFFVLADGTKTHSLNQVLEAVKSS